MFMQYVNISNSLFTNTKVDIKMLIKIYLSSYIKL